MILWDCSSADSFSEQMPGNVSARFEYAPGSADETLTSCSWLHTQQSQFVAGYANSQINFFDVVSGSSSLVQAAKLSPDSPSSARNSQINSLVSHPSQNIVCAGHENGRLSLFDFKADKVSGYLDNAHKEAISSVVATNSGLHLISGSHDGSLKVWDMRKLSGESGAPEPLFEV